MTEHTLIKYTQRVQELVDAINAALYKMPTREWPTIKYKFAGRKQQATLGVVYIQSRNDGEGKYYLATLTNKQRTARGINAVILTQYDLDRIANQVGINLLDYESI